MEISPVIQFEMPAKDRKRMAEFYTKVFGWRTHLLGEDLGVYVLATASGPADGGSLTTNAISDRLFSGPANTPAQYPSIVIKVNDIETQMKKVEEAGGRLLGEIFEIPGVGLCISFLDSEGNVVSMMQTV